MLQLNEYWNIIDEAAKRHPVNQEAYAQYVTEVLGKRSYCDRYRFSQFTEQYMAFAECAGIMMLGEVLDGICSDDSLLYFTLWVISRGKAFFLQAAKNPDALVNQLDDDFDHDFENFMSLGMDYEEDSDDYTDMEIAAWGLTPAEEEALAAEVIFLNGTQNGGFASINAMMQAIPKTLPKLCKRYNIDADEYGEDEQEDGITDKYKAEEEAWRKARAAVIKHLEETLHTSIAVTEKWKQTLRLGKPVPIVGDHRFTSAVIQDGVFVSSDIYSRKKKKPAAIVGLPISGGEPIVYYEDTREMFYTSFICSTDTYYIFVGNYSLMAHPQEFVISVLIFSKTMQLIRQFDVPLNNREWVAAGCIWQGKLYLAANKTLQINLESGQIEDELPACKSLFVYDNRLYFLEGDSFQLGALCCFVAKQTELKQITPHVKEAIPTTHGIMVLQKIDGIYSINLLGKNGETAKIFSLPDCEMENFSANEQIVAFDLFHIGGSRNYEKLTVFYHLDSGEFRLMDADFLYSSYMSGSGFSRIIGGHYGGYNIDCYTNSNETLVWGEISTLFTP